MGDIPVAHVSGFVAAAVLHTDGVSFSNEEVIESAEHDAAKQNKATERRPLGEQLAEREAAKAAEFEAVRKSMYAPPAGINEEDYSYVKGHEDSVKRARQQHASDDAAAIKAFQAAQSRHSSSASGPAPAVAVAVAAAHHSEPKLAVAGVRKKGSSASSSPAAGVKKTMGAVKAATVKKVSTVSALAGYDSDSD